MIFILSILTFIFTLLGGLFALRFKDKLHLVLGFSAGAVIGVAFFDLMPEAISLAGGAYGTSFITSIFALGFVLFMILDRFFMIHNHHDECEHGMKDRGVLGASSLSIHSFLDGVAIGLAFKVSPAVGAIVAVAVLVHDFSDGINTVNMVLKNNGDKRIALRWLFTDALAPLVGVIYSVFHSA